MRFCLTLLLFTLMGISVGHADGKKVFILHGNTDRLFEIAPGKQLFPTFCANILTLAVDLFKDGTSPSFLNQRHLRSQLRLPIEILRIKNYQILERWRISATDLWSAVSDPDAIAVIYLGHSLTMTDAENSLCDSQLPVFQGEEWVPLSAELISKARNATSRKTVSPGLQVVYAGACHSERWTQSFAELLGLSPDKLITTPPGRLNSAEIGRHFSEKFGNWASAVPVWLE